MVLFTVFKAGNDIFTAGNLINPAGSICEVVLDDLGFAKPCNGVLPLSGAVSRNGRIAIIGLDTVLAIADVLYREIGDDKYRAPVLLRNYVAAGWLGRKTGRGFYSYA